MIFLMILSDCDRILRHSKYCRKIITSHDFFLDYSKLFLGRTFLIVNRFSFFLQHILGQNKRRIVRQNILPTVKLNNKCLKNTVIRD